MGQYLQNYEGFMQTNNSSKVKIYKPINNVLLKIANKGFDLKSADALEIFARDGAWHTQSYYPNVKSLEAWEIDSKYFPTLKANLPNAEIKITNSFNEIKVCSRKFDFVVIDNPQSLYGDDLYCEHFELFPDLFRVLRHGSVIVMNVNVKPYNFETNSLWWKRRTEFYKIKSPDNLSIEFLDSFYREMFCSANFGVKWTSFVKRNDYIHYLVMGLDNSAKQ